MEIFSNPLVMDFRDIMNFNLREIYIYIYIYIYNTRTYIYIYLFIYLFRYRDVTNPKLRLSNKIAA